MEEVAEEDSVYDRYNRMSRHQKLGLLMIALGPEASATLLKRFDSKDSEGICKRSEISQSLIKSLKIVF